MLEKTSFFEAVAQVRGLRELHMPQWTVDAKQSSDYSYTRRSWASSFAFEHPEACDPLRSIPGLKIFVRKSDLAKETCEDCFPPSLEFHELE